MEYFKSRLFLTLFLALHLVISVFGVYSYSGSTAHFLLFALAFGSVVVLSLRSVATPTVLFFGLLLWLGFFFKVCIHFLFKRPFGEATGNFSYSAADWDHALLVCTIGGIAFCLATIVINWFLKRKGHSNNLFILNAPADLRPDYFRYKWALLSGFAAVTCIVAVSNLFLGINISGMVAMTILPWPMNAIIAWTLYYGLSMLAGEICFWEYNATGKHRWGFAVVSLEAAAVSISILSRGIFVFHLVPLLILNFANRKLLKIRFKNLIARTLVVALAAIATITCTNYARGMLFNEGTTVFDVYDVYDPDVYLFDPKELKADVPSRDKNAQSGNSSAHSPAPAIPSVGATGKNLFQSLNTSAPEHEKLVESLSGQVLALVLNRWIGIEGVLAVDSYPEKGFALLKKTFVKTPEIGDIDIYNTISKSGYAPSMMYSFTSIPGPIATFYYAGKLWIVALGMGLFCVIMALIDRCVFRFFKNHFLTMILSFQFASVFSQFGLAPSLFVKSFLITFIGLIGLYLLRLSARTFNRKRIQPKVGVS